MNVKGFAALDQQCSGRWCWSPGAYQHRGLTGSGSRATGMSTKCCLERAYRGCPEPLPKPGDPEPFST